MWAATPSGVPASFFSKLYLLWYNTREEYLSVQEEDIDFNPL